MKQLLILFLLGGFCYSQDSSAGKWKDPDHPVNPLVYQEVINVNDQSADRLYKAILEWASDVFVNDEAAISFKDPDLKFIKGSLIIPVSFDGLSSKDFSGKISFDFKVEAKDNRIRYIFDNIRHENRTALDGYYFGLLTTDELSPYDIKWYKDKMENRMWAEIKTIADSNIQALIFSLKNFMNNIPKDDW